MAKVGQLNPRRVRAWAWEQAMRNRRMAQSAAKRAEALATQLLASDIMTPEDEKNLHRRKSQLISDFNRHNIHADRFIAIVQQLNDLPSCQGTTAEEDVKAIGRGDKWK